MELVRRETREIDLECREIGGHLSNPLGRIGMQAHSVLATERPGPRDVGDRASLVVRPHQAYDRDLARPREEERLERVEIGCSRHGGGARQPDHLDSTFLALLREFSNGAVLKPRGHQHASRGFVGREVLERAPDCHARAFGAARTEHQFPFLAADEPRHALAGEFEPALRFAARSVDA